MQEFQDWAWNVMVATIAVVVVVVTVMTVMVMVIARAGRIFSCSMDSVAIPGRKGDLRPQRSAGRLVLDLAFLLVVSNPGTTCQCQCRHMHSLRPQIKKCKFGRTLPTDRSSECRASPHSKRSSNLVRTSRAPRRDGFSKPDASMQCQEDMEEGDRCM